MARITPKTDWTDISTPTVIDFNRIENNTQQAFSELDAEAVNRTAEIIAEANARTVADANLQSNINAEAAARQNADTIINNRLSGELVGNVGAVALAWYQESGASPSIVYSQPVTLSGGRLLVTTDIIGSVGSAITSGVWRCMGVAPNKNANATQPTLWVRIS
jgi:hypothetical protein